MYSVGIDIGGTTIKAGLVSDQGKIVYKQAIPTGADRSWKEMMEDMLGLIEDVMVKSGAAREEIGGIGLGTPGLVDPDQGLVIYSCNLPNCRNVPIKKCVEDRFHLPFYLDNDANVAALGESMFGAGAGHTGCTVLITLGTGLGGGVIINGKIFAGAYHGGTELGHTVIVNGGETCSCGRSGCWEAYSSATGLIRMAKRAAEHHPDSMMWKLCDNDMSKLDGRIIGEAEDAGDKAACEAMHNYIHYLAIGVGNMYNIFQPEIFMIGGGISGRGDKLLKPLLAALQSEIYGGDMSKVDLRMATLGNDAGIIGAASLVFAG